MHAEFGEGRAETYRRKPVTAPRAYSTNRVLREQLGDKRLRFTDEQRRRLAVKGKKAEALRRWRGSRA